MCPLATSPNAGSELEQARPQTSGEEELQLQLALAMSREAAEQVHTHVLIRWCYDDTQYLFSQLTISSSLPACVKTVSVTSVETSWLNFKPRLYWQRCVIIFYFYFAARQSFFSDVLQIHLSETALIIYIASNSVLLSAITSKSTSSFHTQTFLKSNNDFDLLLHHSAKVTLSTNARATCLILKKNHTYAASC